MMLQPPWVAPELTRDTLNVRTVANLEEAPHGVPVAA